MAQKQNDSKNESRHLAITGYANELLTRFKDGFVTPLQNLIHALKTNFKIEVTPAVLHNCLTHCGIETIDAFRDSQRPGYAHDVQTYGVRDNSIEEKVNAVQNAIKPFSDGVQILYNHRSCDLELLDLVEINDNGIVSIKEEAVNFINESAMVYTKTEDGKRLCAILYEVTPLLQEFLDITFKYAKKGNVVSPQLASGVEYWFPARFFTIKQEDDGRKTIKPVEQIPFDALD